MRFSVVAKIAHFIAFFLSLCKMDKMDKQMGKIDKRTFDFYYVSLYAKSKKSVRDGASFEKIAYLCTVVIS